MRTEVVLLVFALLFITACQPTGPLTPAAPATAPAEDAASTADRRWVETTLGGLRVGLPVPADWAIDTSAGLILAEHMSTMETGSPLPGLLVYIFVPPLDRFRTPDPRSDNMAYHVLNQVVEMPGEIGIDVAASDPTPFTWGPYEAAYYLLNSSDGTKTLVLAIEVPEEHRLVVVNVSIGESQVSRIRELLPTILDGLTIAGQPLDGAALDALPDPLIFPSRSETTFDPSGRAALYFSMLARPGQPAPGRIADLPTETPPESN